MSMLTKLPFHERLREEVKFSKLNEYFTPAGFIKLLKLAMLGISKIIVEGGSFVAQTYLGVPREISQVLSQILGIASGFVLNPRFSFNTEQHISLRLIKFVAVRLLSMACGVIFMAVISRTVFIKDNMRSDILAKASVMVLTGCINMLGNRFFVFKNKG